MENIEALKKEIPLPILAGTENQSEKESPIAVAFPTEAEPHNSINTAVPDSTTLSSWYPLPPWSKSNGLIKKINAFLSNPLNNAAVADSHKDPATDLEILRTCTEHASSSIRLMYDVLQILEKFLRQILDQAKTNGDPERNELRLFFTKTMPIIQACATLISTRNSQEQVLASINDVVEDIYRREWMKKMEKRSNSQVTIL